ncbi:hypothetical protein [Bradyrhizobium glycinis]|uniref:hypothetical protein n=1 Tax=Bradyrhizobium glycinis TaxID=2751812 RepID=UPI0018D7230C|nr:hypothetical protein [Bradyrhizobium glycinis]MBH5372243.1 hypothetical protein [Bradyrhizobium glycinis]
MAVTYLGREKGVPVNQMSGLMLVDSSFNNPLKAARKHDLLRHKSSANDARRADVADGQNAQAFRDSGATTAAAR